MVQKRIGHTIDVIINVGSYEGPYTEALIEGQLKIIKMSKGCENVNILYIIAVKEGSPKRDYRELANHINRIAEDLGVQVMVFLNTNDKGLAHGRNIGLLLSKADVVAYLDDDAIPSRNWLNRLRLLFERDKELTGVFGNVQPLFIDKSGICTKIPTEIYWIFSCTPSYMPNKPETFYRGFGTNMAFRREVLYKLGGFKIGLGVGSSKKGWIGGEETELALRLCNKKYKVIYDPNLIVYHVILPSRCTLKYILGRAYHVGRTNRILMHRYSKYTRKECKSQITLGFLKSIAKITLRNTLNIKNAEKLLFLIVASISFFLGMLNRR